MEDYDWELRVRWAHVHSRELQQEVPRAVQALFSTANNRIIILAWVLDKASPQEVIFKLKVEKSYV